LWTVILIQLESRPIHIIIADDDDDDQFIIREALSEMSFPAVHVTQVYDGLQLLDYLHRRGSVASNYQFPDIVLLDINMPLMNGLEALSLIRAHEDLKAIPVYLLSTSHKDMLEPSDLAGSQGFYSKPNRVGAYRVMFEEIVSKTLLQAR
jgi:CheY-like chemotaxis protein